MHFLFGRLLIRFVHKTTSVIIKKILPTLTILFLFFSNPVLSQQQGFGCIKSIEFISFSEIEKNTTLSKPVTTAFPIFGKWATKNDRKFSLPFGVGINSIYYNQAYTASNLLLSSDSTSITARADSMYQNTTAYEMKAYIRPNIWLFPFLNVYAIYGYTKGVISPNLVVPSIILENVPILDSMVVDTTFEIHDDIGYVGPTYGAGATLSLGYRFMFLMVDYNYSVTNPTDLDENLHNHFFSPKAGILVGKNDKIIHGAIWVGAMFISNDQSFSGKVNIEDINPIFVPLLGEEANYYGSIKANQRWNMVIGGSIVINNHHHIVLEAGFLERKQISLGYDFRF